MRAYLKKRDISRGLFQWNQTIGTILRNMVPKCVWKKMHTKNFQCHGPSYIAYHWIKGLLILKYLPRTKTKQIVFQTLAMYCRTNVSWLARFPRSHPQRSSHKCGGSGVKGHGTRKQSKKQFFIFGLQINPYERLQLIVFFFQLFKRCTKQHQA